MSERTIDASERPGREVKDPVHRPSRALGAVIRSIAALIAIAFLAEVLAMEILDAAAPEIGGLAEALFDASLLSVLIIPPVWFLVARPLIAALNAERAQVGAEHAVLAERIERQRLHSRLHNALEMADTEADALGVLSRAICQRRPQRPIELLLADSSQAHMRRAIVCPSPDSRTSEELEQDEAMLCPVRSPAACVAARRGRTLTFEDNRELDSCPRMSAEGRQPHSAVCVPVAIAGRSVGVLRATGPAGAAVGAEVREELEVIAAQAGGRLGMLRAMDSAVVAATTDPLTGLDNRRSLHNRVRPWLGGTREIAVVVADLDHFKQLNDTHSHDVGDRALKVFARTLRDSCRPSDVVARIGGEEFVVVLADVSVDGAVRVMERVRDRLLGAIARAGTPTFTASFGVVGSTSSGDLDTLLKLADMAMYQAKQQGRDRICVTDELPPGPEEDAEPQLQLAPAPPSEASRTG